MHNLRPYFKVSKKNIFVTFVNASKRVQMYRTRWVGLCPSKMTFAEIDVLTLSVARFLIGGPHWKALEKSFLLM